MNDDACCLALFMRLSKTFLSSPLNALLNAEVLPLWTFSRCIKLHEILSGVCGMGGRGGGGQKQLPHFTYITQTNINALKLIEFILCFKDMLKYILVFISFCADIIK